MEKNKSRDFVALVERCAGSNWIWISASKFN